ncbi:Gti1/Pac2 family protein [Colletotrichum salicis]|uniref:Gti1/Pac2 family protein n=1 Tax=Colletotrichum salicis TaxID=1209931 RepID=A0A135T0E3_9PEZI|nr:Gti1/Pac2 family protein [Colletotrichum salicis]
METYHGFVRTPADAIKLFEACRLGLLPRVQRRLSEKERQSIRSGSVFVWDEREAGMRRWTDGKSWSASRVSGSFLTYREMEGKRGSGFGGGRRGAGKTPDSGRGSDEDQEDGEPEGYRYKADGLMKQSFSITTSTGQHLHLISYYSRPHPGSPELQQPSTDAQLRHITPMKGMYPESSLHDSNPTPALTRGPMLQQTPYMTQQHPQQPMPPQAYPPQYAQQPGYSWPPSPVATPPYSHYTTSPYPPQQQPQHQLPPPQVSHSPAQQPHYVHAPPHHHLSPYDRAPLPPPTAQKPLAPYTPQHQSPRLAQIQQPQHQSPRLASIQQSRASESPRISHLQAQAAQAVMIDPRLGPRNPNTLPGINAVSSAPSTSHPITHTPPNRTLSVSPPRSSHSDTNSAAPLPNKASLSALLLHPTPSNSEPSSANGGVNSANSSPRTGGALGGLPPPVDRPANMSHDVKALQALDRKFCI